MQSFYDSHPDGITNKDYSSFINLFRNEINQSPESLLQNTANYFINSNSVQGNLTILTRAKDTLQKAGKMEAFKQICDNNLSQCFYLKNQEDLLTVNFNSAYNYSVLFSKETLFNSHEQDFIRIISILTKPKAFKNTESISISAKLLEKFYEYQKTPQEIDFNLYTSIAITFGLKQTTYSALGTICIESIKVHFNFDVICCFIRCLSHSLSALFDDESILSLFANVNNEPNPNQSKLRKFLIESLPYHCYLLLLSNFIKNFPNQGNTLLRYLDDILGDDSAPIDRCFGYSALSRIVPIVDKPIDFSVNLIKYLLRDYDSQNPILPSLLENLYKSSLKRCKSLNLEGTLYQKLYESIKRLSWHSMVKLMIIPDIIHSFPDLFGDLVDFAQDPSDYGFVTRCVKTIAKTSAKQTSEDLLKVIIKTALKSPIYNDLKTYRPLLEPLYFLIPEIVNKAFEMFNEISNKNGNNYDYNDTNEVIIPIWLRFESLLILPRSKWPMNLFNLKGDLEYSIHSGNWDLRCSALSIFVKCFNIDQIPIDFILNLRTLMFTDSPKHTFLIEDSFNVFIDLLRPKKNQTNKDDNNQNSDPEKILLTLLDIFSYHMSSTFISSHRQFALTLTEILWKKYPHVFTQNHLDAIVSILNDNSLSLRFLCRDKIKAWMREDPTKKFNFSSVSPQLLFDEKSDNKDQNSVNKNNDELLKKLVTEITNNDFEALKELETLINDKKSSVNSTFSKEVLDDQTEKYFDFYIATKNVGISYRSQTVFVSLCNLLDPHLLTKKLQNWENRLLSILRDFDMESMRRSASLPDVALSLIRLQPPELTMSKENDTTSHMKITTALIDLLKRTDGEIEAVNSLNVLRAILKDKIMSKFDDFLYPMIFEAIIVTSMKFEGWDFVAASNLCFATVFHKLFKRSDSTLNIKQFFQKIPKAKELIIEGLKSKITHANYLSLTVLTAFRKTDGDDRSLLKFVVPFISSKSSRIRRATAIAVLLVTPNNEHKKLIDQCIHYVSLSRFVRKDDRLFESNNFFEIENFDRNLSSNSNCLHGLILIIREFLEKKENHNKIDSFPLLDLDRIPPMILSDLCFVYEKLKMSNLMEREFKLGNFYFDQVSTILCAKKINYDDHKSKLNDSQLVALLTKFNSNSILCSENSIEFIEGLDRLIVDRLKSTPLPPLIFKLCVRYLEKLYIVADDKNRFLQNLGFDPALYLNDQIDSEIQTPLINMLSGAEKIKRFVPLFVHHAFNKDDGLTPVKISIANKLPEILNSSPEGKVIAMGLLIDDVPLIRTKTAFAVSQFLNSQFLIEVELFDLLLRRLDQNQLKFMALKWIELIELKSKCDPNGESLSTLVDEFFVVRKAFKALNLNVDFNFEKFQFIPISEGRIQFVNEIKPFFK